MGKERLFRVLVIAISLKGNKIAVSKDEVPERQFAAPVDELLVGGFIEEVLENETSSDDSKQAEEEKAKLEAEKQAEEDAKKLKEKEEAEAKQAEEEKAKSTQSNSDSQLGLDDIANSVPGAAKSNGSKK